MLNNSRRMLSRALPALHGLLRQCVAGAAVSDINGKEQLFAFAKWGRKRLSKVETRSSSSRSEMVSTGSEQLQL